MSNHPTNRIGDEYNDPIYDAAVIPPPPQPHRVPATLNFMECNIQETPYTLREYFENSAFPSGTQDRHNSVGAKLVEMIMIHGDETALMELDRMFVKYQIRNTPIDVIAKELDVSTQAAINLRRSFKDRQKLKVQRLDNFNILGQMLDEIDVTTTELYDILTKTQAEGETQRMPSFQARINAAVAISDNNMKKAKLLEVNGFYKTAKMNQLNEQEIDAVERAKVVLNMVNNTFDTSTYQMDRNQAVDPEEQKEVLETFDQYRQELKDFKEQE